MTDLPEAVHVEYLYGTFTGEDERGYLVTRIVPFRIAKRTAQRVYYVRDEAFGPYAARLGFIDRQRLEAEGRRTRADSGTRTTACTWSRRTLMHGDGSPVWASSSSRWPTPTRIVEAATRCSSPPASATSRRRSGSMSELSVRATRYTVSRLPESDINYRRGAIDIEYRGQSLDGWELWVVLNVGAQLHPDGTWRDHDYYAWPDFDSARDAAIAAIDTTPSAQASAALNRRQEPTP